MSTLPYKVFSNSNRWLAKNPNIPPKMSLLIGFYNNIDFLKILFASIEMQTFKDFEVIICDDGSKPEVCNTIHEYMKQTDLRIQHIWHPDSGWRKVELLNKAIVNSESDYFITIDQDCILHPEFMKEHFLNQEKDVVLSGRRVELSPFLSKLVTEKKIKDGFLQRNFWWMFFFLFYRKNNQWDKGVYVGNSFLRKFLNRKYRPVVGCNMSFSRSTIQAVNGFDMSFLESRGAEDSDLGCRLENAGFTIKPVCHSAVQYHLYHPIRKKDDDSMPKLFVDNRKNRTIKTQNGLDLILKVEKIQI